MNIRVIQDSHSHMLQLQTMFIFFVLQDDRKCYYFYSICWWSHICTCVQTFKYKAGHVRFIPKVQEEFFEYLSKYSTKHLMLKVSGNICLCTILVATAMGFGAFYIFVNKCSALKPLLYLETFGS